MRCREIVRNLLDFARQQHHEPVSTDLNEVVEQTLKLVSHQASLGNIEIATALDEDLPAMIADPAQMEQVFLNLLVNACDAMPDGGRIRIASGRHDALRQVWVAVSDTGRGIDPETLGRVFEPFFSTKRGRSSGLGLSVSWGIVQQHGGRLEVESEQDQGTTFRVVMPTSREATVSSPSEETDDGQEG
jgi:two-component system NtrC family sensor kinase